MEDRVGGLAGQRGSVALDPRDHRFDRFLAELSGDVSDLSVSEIIDAMLVGDIEGFDRNFARYAASGGQLFLVLNGAMRELQWMRPLRHEIENRRKDASQLIAGARPPQAQPGRGAQL